LCSFRGISDYNYSDQITSKLTMNPHVFFQLFAVDNS
jgi:hypothetical protein